MKYKLDQGLKITKLFLDIEVETSSFILQLTSI